jgi:hypothetical protein
MSKYTNPKVDSIHSTIGNIINAFKDEFGKRAKNTKDTDSKLAILVALILEMVAAIMLKKEFTELEKKLLVEAIVEVWLNYCNISFFPDLWESWVIKILARALIDGIIAYFKSGIAKKSIFLKLA